MHNIYSNLIVLYAFTLVALWMNPNDTWKRNMHHRIVGANALPPSKMVSLFPRAQVRGRAKRHKYRTEKNQMQFCDRKHFWWNWITSKISCCVCTGFIQLKLLHNIWRTDIRWIRVLFLCICPIHILNEQRDAHKASNLMHASSCSTTHNTSSGVNQSEDSSSVGSIVLSKARLLVKRLLQCFSWL